MKVAFFSTAKNKNRNKKTASGKLFDKVFLKKKVWWRGCWRWKKKWL